MQYPWRFATLHLEELHASGFKTKLQTLEMSHRAKLPNTQPSTTPVILSVRKTRADTGWEGAFAFARWGRGGLIPAGIPDICHEPHEHVRVNFFWPV